MHVQHTYREFLSSVSHCDCLTTHLQLQPAFVTSKTAPKLVTNVYCTYSRMLIIEYSWTTIATYMYMYKHCTVLIKFTLLLEVK